MGEKKFQSMTEYTRVKIGVCDYTMESRRIPAHVNGRSGRDCDVFPVKPRMNIVVMTI